MRLTANEILKALGWPKGAGRKSATALAASHHAFKS